MINAPLLLWASGGVMFGLGLWRHDDPVVGFGGAGVIAGLVRRASEEVSRPVLSKANIDPTLVDAIVDEALKARIDPSETADVS